MADDLDLTGRLADILEIGGSAPAVQYDGVWYSWAWLAAVGEEIERLLPDGVPGMSVGLVTRNRPGVVAVYVGAWSNRRPVLTLNALASDETLLADIEEMRPAVVVATSEDWARHGFKDTVAAVGAGGLELGLGPDPVRAVTGLERVGSGPHHRCEDGVAVILQTSGTTGRPKRIPLRLSDLGASVAGARKLVGASNHDRPRLRSGATILALPLGHMSAVFSICLNMVEGRRLVLMDRFEPHKWAQLVQEHDVKVLNLVPAAMRMVLDAGIPKELLAGAKIARSGTAALAPALAEEFENAYGLPVLQNYGSTEFAGGVAGWNLGQWQHWGRSKRGSVGIAAPGVELRIVDTETGETVDPGVQGLLEVCSPHTVGVPPGTWVRTNDLAELDEDGFLWIRGRVDDVIIRGGFKIDANEVKEVIESHPLVKEAIVVSLPNSRLGEIPAVALVARPGENRPEPDEIKAFVRQRMEHYKVPVLVMVVDSLPRNSAMKVQLPAVRALFDNASTVEPVPDSARSS